MGVCPEKGSLRMEHDALPVTQKYCDTHMAYI